ncbi:hypothetical protein HanRHA438_Chr07g0299091 [Helianthus annuus]|nr:hypothetical protein HanRHA438_Chr07g0299091 [Helianthus annuus]
MSKISPDPTMVWSVKVVETRSTLQDQSIQPEVSPGEPRVSLSVASRSTLPQ